MLNKPLAVVVAAAVACLTAASFAGCSGSGSGGTGGGSGGGSGTGGGTGMVTADQACGDFATAFCGKFNTCYPFLITVTYGDMGTCATRVKLGCTAQNAANGTGATPTNIEACKAAVPGIACTDILDNTTPSACNFKGTLSNGTACGDNGQCSSGFCNINSGTCGACAAIIPAGSSCTNGGCDTGLTCAGGVCKAPGAAGATCSDTAPCKGSLVCKSGTCATPQTSAGGTCSPTASDCQLASGIFCNQNSVCANIDTAAAGDPCGVVAGALTVCKGSGACMSSGLSGTCASPKADGASCGTNDKCLPPASCVGGVCKLPNPSSCM
jgi:hypothetical protein